MIAAICCPGSSLLRTYVPDAGTHGEVWAVNTAIKKVAADWLAAGDLPMFRGVLGQARPTRGVITFAECAREARDQASWSGLEWDTWQAHPVVRSHHASGRPINWSLQAALCHAAGRGATAIEIYGCDLAGIADCTGYIGEDRSDHRWMRERADLEYTLRFLFDRYAITAWRIQ